MSFLRTEAFPHDPKTKGVKTLTGQKIGFLKYVDHTQEWAFLPSDTNALLTIPVLEEIVTLIQNVEDR